MTDSFRCPIESCGATFLRSFKLAEHVKRIHDQKVDNSMLMKACPRCFRGFRDFAQLSKHELRCQPQKQFENTQDTLIHTSQPSQESKGPDAVQIQLEDMQCQIDELRSALQCELQNSARLAEKLGQELKRERTRIWALSQH